MEELLTRGVEEIIPLEEFKTALASGKKLRIKFGVDPTRPDIHIGHAVVLNQLRQLQEMGHTVIFLIGDYTTKIGDPSGRSKTRPVLSDEEIKTNAKTYLDQVGLILDVNKAEIRYNSEWLSKLTFADLLALASNLSVAQLIERDDFKNRIDVGQELALHELLYPLMQAYDSVALKADVEFGGSDQLFNLLTGRSLQKKMGQKPQSIFSSKLLVGTDGVKKMSKSLDNYIGITDAPADMYGKIMSIPDSLIAPYYELCTSISMDVIDELVKSLAGGANPRDAKASLARELVRTYHGDTAALAAEDAFNKQFRDGEKPDDIPEVTVSKHKRSVVDLLVELELAASKNEARRLIEQGGVRLNDDVITEDKDISVTANDLVQVGKRRFVRLKTR